MSETPSPPATRDATIAAALYPSMAPRPSDTAAPAPTTPQPQALEVVAEPSVTIPESHWARVEDERAWEAEVTAGPLAASLPAARAFLTQHAPPELVQMLEQTGYGSNPYVIQFVADLAAKFHTDGTR